MLMLKNVQGKDKTKVNYSLHSFHPHQLSVTATIDKSLPDIDHLCAMRDGIDRLIDKMQAMGQSIPAEPKHIVVVEDSKYGEPL